MPDNLHELVSRLIVDTKGTADTSLSAITKDSSLWAFLPELILCATIVLMLLVKVFKWGRRVDAFYIFLAGSILALVVAAPWTYLVPGSLSDGQLEDPSTVSRMEIFTGMLVYDTFSVFVRSLLLLFVVLFAFFTRLSGIPDREDGPDIYTLVLGSTVGMCLMGSANHVLMVFLAVEMASVPSYALAGMMKGKRKASEAALKYSIYGAGAAGVMLYGISLIAGLLNTAHLPTMTVRLAEQLPAMGSGEIMVLALAGLMIMVGLAFKLSAVPFHFWCPDVFEGATAEVNAFLSVASKGAALALLVRVAVSFGAFAPASVTMDDITADNGTFIDPADKEELADVNYYAPGVRTAIAENRKLAEQPAGDQLVGQMSVADNEKAKPKTVASDDDSEEEIASSDPLATSRDFFAKMVAFFAIITCTFGNLAAYGQTNIKRLMAYSTIAHAGYMMMAVPALMAASGLNPEVAQTATAGLCIYLGVYLFMNLGAFAIIAFLRNAMHSEEIADYGGLIKRSPVIAICLTLILFSLIGLPPLAGFIGKFAVFSSLADSYRETQIAGQPATYLMVLLFAGGINTGISLFYYLRVARVMLMDPEPDTRRPFTLSWVSLPGFYVVLIVVPVVFLFFFWNGLSEMAFAAARHLLS